MLFTVKCLCRFTKDSHFVIDRDVSTAQCTSPSGDGINKLPITSSDFCNVPVVTTTVQPTVPHIKSTREKYSESSCYFTRVKMLRLEILNMDGSRYLPLYSASIPILGSDFCPPLNFSSPISVILQTHRLSIRQLEDFKSPWQPMVLLCRKLMP